MTTVRLGDIGDTFGSGGANVVPGGAQGAVNMRDAFRQSFSNHGAPYANLTALTASKAADRSDGQLVTKLDDYSIWQWQSLSVVAADATHVAPTDVGAGAGRWFQVVAAPAGLGAGGVRSVAIGQSPATLVAANDLIEVASNGGAITINMEAAPVVGQIHKISDTGNDSFVNNITISGNGKNVENPNAPGTFAASVAIAVNGAEVTWEYDGTRWVIV